MLSVRCLSVCLSVCPVCNVGALLLFLLSYTYKALLAEMCRIGDFKAVGHIEAKF